MKISANSAAAAPALAGPLSRVVAPVQAELDEVDRRIAAQTSAFDPAIEGYVAYAVGGAGKRLRPLVALLSGGATGSLGAGHVDLAVIIELIHLATACMTLGGSLDYFVRAVFNYPTLADSFKDAAYDGLHRLSQRRFWGAAALPT